MAHHLAHIALISAPLISLLTPVTYGAERKYVQVTDSDEITVLVPDDRRPSLYTQDFGNCMGSSLINVSRFDAAWYKDNMTVLFHLEGTTQVANDSLMMYIGVSAYGESRFDLTFDPCHAQIYSLCPLNRSVPIQANGVIPISQNDVANIPPIALTIPDFEGQAILRIFSNSTRQEISCFSATITNGQTFSQPAAVGTILGLFTVIALVASFATAIYGDHIPTMRTHYAHSLSMFVVFAVFHHIYYTGALSVNWPSVLVAWWSNFAWAGGMIYSETMQNSINKLVGNNFGDLTMVGSAGTGAGSDDIGGGYEISQIYKRSATRIYKRCASSLVNPEQLLQETSLGTHLAKREAASSNSVDSPWHGKQIRPGLPIPGNYSGLAGTLSKEEIPASNAFMTGFFWLVILTVLLVTAVATFKWTLESVSKRKKLSTPRFNHFRTHWLKYCTQTALRAMFVGFFMMMYLMLFQFTFRGSGGAAAIASLTFIGLFIGMCYLVSITCYERLRYGHFDFKSDRLHIEKSQALGFLPWIGLGLNSRRIEGSAVRPSICSFAIKTMRYVEGDRQLIEVHQDEDFIMRRGWLFARFRRTRWWFFAPWILYEFTRACFFGGAAGHAMTQVFGLLIVEFIALFAIIKTRPFEGSRLNALMVYLLGFSKVLTVALSAAFDPRFNLTRINTTVVGVVIIVIQGILTIALMVAIILGAVSSYMSLTRDREDFRPHHWVGMRERYFAHLEKAAADLAPPPPAQSDTEEKNAPYFDIRAVRRENKIEDDEEGYANSVFDPCSSRVSIPLLPTARASRPNSLAQRDGSSGNLPFGARNVHRASWSTKDVEIWSTPDSTRQSRHMSAAAGLYKSRPTSRHASVHLNHQSSDCSLKWQRKSSQPISPGANSPSRVAPVLDVRKSRPGTAVKPTATVEERDSEDREETRDASPRQR